MARKSKGNFNLKGHSIPGIKGFKDTTLEDGRAASSAFQMQSPLYVETNSDVTLDTSDPTKDLDLSGGMDKSLTKSNKESSAQYLFRQKMLFNQRKEDREKEKAKSSVEKIDDQTTKYTTSGDVGDNSITEFQSPASDQFKSDEVENIKKDINENLSDQVVMSTPTAPEAKTIDYSGASKNEMTNIRRKIKDSGEDFDYENNPEHAEIQNKINELYGSSKTY